jgi:hypothetical protein
MMRVVYGMHMLAAHLILLSAAPPRAAAAGRQLVGRQAEEVVEAEDRRLWTQSYWVQRRVGWSSFDTKPQRTIRREGSNRACRHASPPASTSWLWSSPSPP